MKNRKAPALLAVLMSVILAIPAVARQDDAKTTTDPVPVEATIKSAPAKNVISKVVVKTIPFGTEYRFDRTLVAGRVRKITVGKPGEIRTTIEITKDSAGKETGRKTVSTVRTEPIKEIIGMGKQGHSTSRGSFTRSSVRTMESTAYLPSAGLKNPTFKTKMGLPAKYGVIAVDPRVIPLGSLVFVEGYGFAIAADTGGAIKGNKIDVCLHGIREVRNWGRRKVKVHVFNERARR